MDWRCTTPPCVLWITHGKSAHSGSNGSCGNPSSFPAGPGQAACCNCSHTAVLKAMINSPEARDHRPSVEAHCLSGSLQCVLRIGWYMTGKFGNHCPSWTVVLPVQTCCAGKEKGESCWIRTVQHCKVLFFWVKIRDYVADPLLVSKGNNTSLLTLISSEMKL